MTCCDCQGINLSLLDQLLERYAKTSENIIPIMQETQGMYGYLPRQALEKIAEVMAVPVTQLMGIATFYSQFRLKPLGKNLIMVCQGTACHVNGSENIAVAVQEAVGVAEGEISADGLFTWENVACLGCCSLAPVMMINGEVYGSLTPDSAKKVIDEVRAKATAEVK